MTGFTTLVTYTHSHTCSHTRGSNSSLSIICECVRARRWIFTGCPLQTSTQSTQRCASTGKRLKRISSWDVFYWRTKMASYSQFNQYCICFKLDMNFATIQCRETCVQAWCRNTFTNVWKSRFPPFPHVHCVPYDRKNWSAQQKNKRKRPAPLPVYRQNTVSSTLKFPGSVRSRQRTHSVGHCLLLMLRLCLQAQCMLILQLLLQALIQQHQTLYSQIPTICVRVSFSNICGYYKGLLAAWAVATTGSKTARSLSHYKIKMFFFCFVFFMSVLAHNPDIIFAQ